MEVLLLNIVLSILTLSFLIDLETKEVKLTVQEVTVQFSISLTNNINCRRLSNRFRTGTISIIALDIGNIIGGSRWWRSGGGRPLGKCCGGMWSIGERCGGRLRRSSLGRPGPWTGELQLEKLNDWLLNLWENFTKSNGFQSELGLSIVLRVLRIMNAVVTCQLFLSVEMCSL